MLIADTTFHGAYTTLYLSGLELIITMFTTNDSLAIIPAASDGGIGC